MSADCPHCEQWIPDLSELLPDGQGEHATFDCPNCGKPVEAWWEIEHVVIKPHDWPEEPPWERPAYARPQGLSPKEEA